MQQQHLSSFLDQLIGELRQLCREGRSGTLFVTTDDSHPARFALREGAIAGIVYRTKSGLDAIQFIKEIRGGTFSFSNSSIFLSGTVPLPSAPEIFRLLSSVSEPIAPRSVPAKKILVVEDSGITRRVIAKALTDGGYTVLEAENGMAAFAQLSETRPDLMLLDIVMPGIDGYKVLSMIRKHDDFKRLPVIMLTSRDGLLDKLRGRIGGSNEYLTKPFTPEELLDKIAKYLG